MTSADTSNPPAAIKGTLERVWSPQLRNHRTVDVYLPASYRRGGRYPVVYMQDGQNLSDPATAFAGTWNLDATLCRLAASGIEPIVVGIHNAGDARLAEYSPFADARHGGGAGDAYLSFVADTLKPRVDRLFRTDRAPARTGIVGSSMGGLISLYAWFSRPDAFELAAAMSPALWYGRAAVFDFVSRTPLPRGRLYVDVGTAEGAEALRDVRSVRRLIVSKGGNAGTRFAWAEDRGARHDEAAWGRRLPSALEFLLDRRIRGRIRARR